MPSLLQHPLEEGPCSLLSHYKYLCNISLVEPLGSVSLKRKNEYFYLIKPETNDGEFFI
jgi:hypothetical protein